MSHEVTRRALLGGAALLPAACAGAPPPPQGIQPLPTTSDLVLAPSEGLVVGAVAFALRDVPGMSRENLSRGDRSFNSLGRGFKFVFADAQERRYDLPVAPIGPAAVEASDAGATVYLTPFAFKLPAGTCRVLGTASFFFGSTPPGWWPDWLAPCEFDVAAGRVTYVGRLGRIQYRVHYPTPEERTAVCPEHRNLGNWTGRYPCHYDRLFVDDRADHDLPLIRRAYGALGTRAIDAKPVRLPREDWQRKWWSWPAVLQP